MDGHDLVCARCGGRVALGGCAACRRARAEFDPERRRQWTTGVAVVLSALLASLGLLLSAGRDGTLSVYGF